MKTPSDGATMPQYSKCYNVHHSPAVQIVTATVNLSYQALV